MICENVETKENIFMYTWTEDENGRASNEVASALIDFLATKVVTNEFRDILKLELFSDCCPGQNKNTTVMVALLQFSNKHAKKIYYYFPVRGHSIVS